jgi:hypothetical protein
MGNFYTQKLLTVTATDRENNYVFNNQINSKINSKVDEDISFLWESILDKN